MAKVVSLESVKKQKAARRGFREWKRHFKDLPALDEQTRWADLPDALIHFLAEDSFESRPIVHDLLMGVMGLGSGYEFESLPSERLLPLMDAYFVVIDQVRFECMRRLGWIQEILLPEQPITETIRNYDRVLPAALLQSPILTPLHPAYSDYPDKTDLEQRVLLRKYIPEAVKKFGERIKKPGNKP
jgi:hypothetical protein